MDDEAREILRIALAEEQVASQDLGMAIRQRFTPFGGIELPAAPRGPMREPPKFDP